MSNLDSYHRAVSGQSAMNEARIIAEFSRRGIPEREIIPRVNVFTYGIWRSKKLKRQVRLGEKGVKIIAVFEDKKGKKRVKTASVFHVSQTDPM